MVDIKELHDLDEALGSWLYPRIVEYRSITRYCPSDLTDALWDRILEKIEQAAYLLMNPDGEPLDNRRLKIQEGLMYLSIYATELWF